ncbi:MAG: ribosome silencing factor [Gemmatimonadetes bacterium]|nr:MAG: ribosome silencing factor [Gemmatimonadota bacterium]
MHTDAPEAVFTYAGRWGTLTSTKADDMRAQHRALQHTARRPVAIVTDTSADLPDAVLDRHHIALVPLQIVFGDAVYQDRVEITPEEFYRRLRAANELPTTSQPTPADFVRVFRSALNEADEVVVVLLGSALSGTFQAARAAVKAAGLDGVHLVDSRAASLCLGLLALRAAELAESGWRAAEITPELERVRSQSGVLLTVDIYDNLIRSGRVSRGKAWLAGMLDVKPILALDGTGRVVPVDRVRGREAVLSRVLTLLDRQLTPRPETIRFGVVHAGSLRADCGVPPAGLLRVAGDRRPRHARGAGGLGALLAGRGRHPGPARRKGSHRVTRRHGAEHRQARHSVMVEMVLGAADDLKAREMVALDLRGLNDATDWFIIASGTSDAHVRGIAQAVLTRLDAAGVRAHHVEGLQSGRWVLLDFVDVVVHLFHPEARAFYQLERLWHDAPRLATAAERKFP